MSDREVPEYARLYTDAMRALPLPGERMTADSFEKVRGVLWADALTRMPSDGNAPASDVKPAEKDDGERPKLTAGSHLADSSRAGRTPHPDTTAGFGFGRRYGW